MNLVTPSPLRCAVDPAARTAASVEGDSVAIDVHRTSLYYGVKRALFDVTLRIPAGLVTACIGPSGCGKSTFLRTINRMNDLIAGSRVTGKVMVNGTDINSPTVDPVGLRQEVGMVFQKSNPFPRSIYDNVAYGPG
jgi:phosphate transport system ATP-binding protein